MKYYTSDLHFYHAKVIGYETRPFDTLEQMHENLISKWNTKVEPTDEVFVLGDFAFCHGSAANQLLDCLQGRKYLILGNHDSFAKESSFDTTKFEWIRDYAKIHDDGHKVILFHYPIAVWDCKHHDSVHLYGHVHTNKTTSHPLAADLGENAFNVGVDVNDFEPKTLSELMNRG